MEIKETEVLHVAEQLDQRAERRSEIAVAESWDISAKERAEAARDVSVLRHCASALRVHAATLR